MLRSLDDREIDYIIPGDTEPEKEGAPSYLRILLTPRGETIFANFTQAMLTPGD
jgi:hypothetical protein